MSIYYYVPDNNKPSWGIGIIYYHVFLLIKSNYTAFVLHQKKDFRLPWLNLKVPFRSLDEFPLKQLQKDDILVVPEVCMDLKGLKSIKCKKIVFIQAPGYIYESLPLNETHFSMGFSEAIVIMPHQLSIVQQYIKLPTHLIPPFIPKMFFKKDLHQKRKKQIILYPKFHHIDYTIVRKLLYDKLKEKRKKVLGVIDKKEWEVIELKGYHHEEIPGIMSSSEIFISLNTFEALNTSVVEAMACGCIVFTYEAFGPRDYLENNKNAFVFGNNEPYQLCEKLFEITDRYDEMKDSLMEMRHKARETAHHYNLEDMEEALLQTYKNIASSN